MVRALSYSAHKIATSRILTMVFVRLEAGKQIGTGEYLFAGVWNATDKPRELVYAAEKPFNVLGHSNTL